MGTRRLYGCRICGRLGHNAQRCPERASHLHTWVPMKSKYHHALVDPVAVGLDMLVLGLLLQAPGGRPGYRASPAWRRATRARH